MTKETDPNSAPEFDELARQYLDLWQDQWTALATDPMVAEAMARGFQMMGPSAAAFANFANLLSSANLYAAPNTGFGGATGDMYGQDQGLGQAPYPGKQAGPVPNPGMPGYNASPSAEPKNDNNEPDATNQSGARPDAAAPGAASAAAAHAGGDGDMAQLFNRLASLEQRLADLASALEGPGGSAATEDRDTGTGGRG
ncbi:MAG: hypothetical protein AAF556_09035 [Pseudomonadota bacterium]